jgi:HPt (histidine-containing phosphotransfer) domain-containing protein
LLEIFARDHADDMATLRKLFASGETTNAQRLVHTLKGVTATLGADAAHQCILELELALREQALPEDIGACIGELEASMTPLLAAMQHLSDAGTPSPPPLEMDSVRTREILGILEALLAEDDTRASQVWIESAPIIKAALGSAAAMLEKQIESFEYDRALQTLREAISSSLG